VKRWEIIMAAKRPDFPAEWDGSKKSWRFQKASQDQLIKGAKR